MAPPSTFRPFLSSVTLDQAARPVAASYLDQLTDRPGRMPQVLLLEDQAIIALDIEGILTEAGLAVVGTLATCASALAWLDTNTADVALIDMYLLDGSCEPVARRLVEKGMPFVVFSGSSETGQTLDPAFAAGSWLAKPAPAEMIVAAVRDALLRKA